MKNFTILVVAATFAASSLTVARADDAFEPRSVTVRFADLEATTDQGAAALYHRLKNAAQNVCRDLESAKELGRLQIYNDCIHTAIGNAVAKVNRPAVTAYAVARGVPVTDPKITVAVNK
jgi:UrcA family protein